MADVLVKTGGKTGRPGTFRTGHDPRRGCGKKGRSGRKPGWFHDFCADVLDEKATKDAIRAALQSPDTPGYSAVIRAVAAYAVGAPDGDIAADGTAVVRFTLRIGATLVEPDDDE